MLVAELGLVVCIGGYALIQGLAQGLDKCKEYRKLKQRRSEYEQNAPLCPPDCEFGEDLCSICLEELSECSPRHVRKLTCSHMFHKKCIDTWIWNEKTTCPNCNQEMIHKDSS